MGRIRYIFHPFYPSLSRASDKASGHLARQRELDRLRGEAEARLQQRRRRTEAGRERRGGERRAAEAAAEGYQRQVGAKRNRTAFGGNNNKIKIKELPGSEK